MNQKQRFVYWEKQEENRLCGLYTVNALLQGPYYDEASLSEIANALDSEEKKLMKSQKGGFKNVSIFGEFNIEVLNLALKEFSNLTVHYVQTKDVETRKINVNKEIGFILHTQDHWFPLRRVNNYWVNLNSLNPLPGPIKIADYSIEPLLLKMVSSKYTVLVVKGNLPDPEPKKFKNLRPTQFFIDMSTLPYNDEEPKSFKVTEQPKENYKAFEGKAFSISGNNVVESKSQPLSEEEQILKISELEYLSEQEKKLPPEPKEGEKDTVLIMLRLPSGKSVQRRFRKNESTKILFNFAKIKEGSNKNIRFIQPLDKLEVYEIDSKMGQIFQGNTKIFTEFLE